MKGEIIHKVQLYYKDEYIRLFQGDCLEAMDKLIEKGIMFDAIITDPPYGTTQCKWDSVIPFDDMWLKIKQLRNKNSPTILFGSEPFSSNLRMNNIQEFKYDWYWKKSKASNFANAKKMPMKDIEIISIFYQSLPTYNPQGIIKCEVKKHNGNKTEKHSSISALNGGAFKTDTYNQEFTNYPKQLLEFNSEGKTVHPTQKPIDLLEYLINTYTNENDLILDFTCGSGTTLLASRNLKRKCIGIELEEKYCEIAKNRLIA